MEKDKYINKIIKEKNMYKTRYENALTVLNKEIETIKLKRMEFIKLKKMNNLELLQSDYFLRTFIEIKRRLEEDV